MLLWDIEDVSEILPALEITSHLEITCFEFHPTKPNILIGKCIDKNVLMSFKRWNNEWKNCKMGSPRRYEPD